MAAVLWQIACMWQDASLGLYLIESQYSYWWDKGRSRKVRNRMSDIIGDMELVPIMIKNERWCVDFLGVRTHLGWWVLKLATPHVHIIRNRSKAVPNRRGVMSLSWHSFIFIINSPQNKLKIVTVSTAWFSPVRRRWTLRQASVRIFAYCGILPESSYQPTGTFVGPNNRKQRPTNDLDVLSADVQSATLNAHTLYCSLETW